MKRKIKKALFQFALIVFFLNTTSVYGACCFGIDAETTTDAPTEVPANSMPCHHQQTGDAVESGDDCCLMCVSMMTADSTVKAAPVVGTKVSATTSLLATESGIDPPFRPPIQILS